MSVPASATPAAPDIERALIVGDLSGLTEAQRVSYYLRVCDSLRLNPLTRPFEYVRLNGRLVLYATRAAADQLRRNHGVSLEIVSQGVQGDLYVVHVRARDKEGRTDEEIGAVPIAGLKGEALANAMLKAVTKAKRRATLSLCGLGWLDETEIQSIPEAQPVQGPPIEALPSPSPGDSGAPAGAPPAGAPPEAPPGPGEVRLATPAQRRMLYSLWKQRHQLSDEAAKTWLRGRYGVESSKELKATQASEAIDYLKSVSTLDLANEVQAYSRQDGVPEPETTPNDDLEPVDF
jgi:hypothetical protein